MKFSVWKLIAALPYAAAFIAMYLMILFFCGAVAPITITQ